MNVLNNNELKEINGGEKLSLSAALVNAFSRGINTISDLGRTLGTSIRMIKTGKRC